MTSTLIQFVSLLQTTWILSKLRVRLPGAIGDLFSGPGRAFDLSIFELGCGRSTDPRGFAMLHTLMVNLAPIVVLAVGGILFLMAYKCPKPGTRMWPGAPEVISSLFACFGTFFITIADSAANTGLATMEHPNGETSLKAFLYLLESDSDAQAIKAISVISLLIWCCGGMTVVIACLFALRKRSEDVSFRRSLFGITLKYSNEAPWWYIIVLVQNLLVAMSVTFFQDGLWQTTFMSCVLIVYISLLCSYRPYLAPLAHYSDLCTSIGKMLFLICIPMYSTEQYGEALMWVILVFTYIPCVGFFAWAIYTVILFQVQQMEIDPRAVGANLAAFAAFRVFSSVAALEMLLKGSSARLGSDEQ